MMFRTILKNVRFKLSLICLFTTGAVLGVVRPALACPPCMVHIQFFSDSACQNQVGWREITCGGTTQGGNTGAPYETYQQYEPCLECEPHVDCDVDQPCFER